MRVETFVNGKLKDLNPLFFGYDDMQPGIMCGTRIRNDVFIHYVHDGIFCFELRGERHMVQSGEVFVILPGAEYNYYNPGREACRVSWIALSGELSADFAALPPVFAVDKAIFEEIDAVHEAQGRKDILLSSILMRWYHSLFMQLPQKSDRVLAVKDYIEVNYMQPIRVEEIAEALHIHRTHLARIFKQSTGKTMQEYLISQRLQKARDMLCDGKSVEETARLCGFSSVSHFSKTFSKYYSFAPKAFQKDRRRV